MNLIAGYFKHSRKARVADTHIISEVYISSILDSNDPDEYLVSDGNRNVPVFKYINESSREVELRGYLKYRLGDKRRKFKLVEGQGKDTTLLIDGRQFYIHSEASDTPISYLIFSESRLKEGEVNSSENTGEIQLEFRTDSPEDHSSIVLSFLGLIEPQCHTQFFYFCISNISTTYGQTLVSYSDGLVEYYTVLSPIFLNFNELFLDVSFIPRLVNAPYFPNTNFIVSHNWEEVYESKKYVLGCNYPPKFILEVLTSILLEERIVFYSAGHSALKVLGILSLVRPFIWPHILCLPLPAEMEEILESPLPFIVCINKKLNRDGVVFVDFDALKIYGMRKQQTLPFVENMKAAMKKNLKGAIRSCIGSIAREILLDREEMIRRYGKTMLKDIINDPTALLEGEHPFYDNFFKTRMFLVFITEEYSHSCRYLVELGHTPAVILLPYTLLTDEFEIRALRLWLELFSGDMDPVIEHLKSNRLLETVADVVFRRLSYDKDYDGIWRVLSCIRNPTHEMYANINIVSKMPRIKFGDLCAYTIYHLNACDCKAFVFGNSIDNKNMSQQDGASLASYGDRKNGVFEDTGSKLKAFEDIFPGSFISISNTTAANTVSLGDTNAVFFQNKDNGARLQRENMQRKIKKLLQGIKQSIFNLENGNCCCNNKTSVLLVDGPEYSFLCFLLSPENISLLLRCSAQENLFETNPQVYWSIVAYFSYFTLPFTWNTMKKEVDFIIEEDSSFDFQIDGRPRFYFNP